jgi:hypothetical protein
MPPDGGTRTGWQRALSFGTCVCLQVILPAAPVIAELLLYGGVQQKSLAVFGCTYILCMGLTARSRFVGALSLTLGLITALAYSGTDIDGSRPLTSFAAGVPWVTIWITVALFLIDRGRHHLFEGRPYELFSED